MSSGFVKTSVLEVSGNFHGEETRVESDDVKRQEFRAAQAAQRPLFDQLEEQKDKKDAEYDAVTKMMFAPTKALDEEEAQHMNDVEDAKRTSRELLRMQESHQLDGFKLARMNRTLVQLNDAEEVGGAVAAASNPGAAASSGHGVQIAMAKPKARPVEAKLNVKLKKRKVGKSAESDKAFKCKKSEAGVEGESPTTATSSTSSSHQMGLTPDSGDVKEGAGDEPNPLAALGGYGSEETD